MAKTESVALVGAEARLVAVEVHVATGLPRFWIVGLPTKSVTEAEQRTRSALVSSGLKWPSARITANLAPGALRKEGTHFDLAIALGILAGDGRVDPESLDGWLCIGELGLDGSVRAVPGTLAAAMAARQAGRRGIVCPAPNGPEAAIVGGIEVVPVTSLHEALRFFRGTWVPTPVQISDSPPSRDGDDICEVRGHRAAKRAMEIAAAGGHNVMLVGPPGSGKTMLARRLPRILPSMSLEESLEVTRVYSIAGLLGERASLIRERPFRTPHHHVSLAGLIGGGMGIARPGEISLCHQGVLFLDELSMYRRDVLESLRAPMEDGCVRIARSGGSICYPCRFSLVAAMNPCPCGLAGDSGKDCRCSKAELVRYKARLSGPLLDRLDMQVGMARLGRKELLGPTEGESSECVRERVERARLLQADRYGSTLITNASASRADLDKSLRLSSKALGKLGGAIDSLALSGRGMTRVLRIARTIADLQGGGDVNDDHIGEALMYRFGETDTEVAA